MLNVVNGFGVEAGKPLASNKRIRKIAFTGETTTGRLIMQYASENLIPVTLELGGKSPNIFFDDVAGKQDDFYDKALEGFAMFALNQGEVCTCPSRALIQGGIYTEFLAQGVKRTEQIKQGNPLDTDTMIGAQASNDQLEKILSYIDIGRQEGAKLLTGGERADLGGELSGGYYVQPTIFEGNNSMRIFQEEIFGPVVSVTRFADYDDAMKIANDTLYGLGAGVWSPRRQHGLPGRAGHPGRPGVGEQLPRLPGARGVRRLQAVRHRPGEPQDDARPLPADQEPAGQLLAERAGLLLMSRGGRAGTPSRGAGSGTERVALTPAAAELLVKLTALHGPLMFHQSGGCCDGSAPMCYPDGDFRIGGSDVHLGDLTVDGLDADRVLHVGVAVRVLEAHPPHGRRGAGPGQRVLGGGAGGRPVPDPVAAVHRRGVADAERHVRTSGPGPSTEAVRARVVLRRRCPTKGTSMSELHTLRGLAGLPAIPGRLADSTLIMIDLQNTYTRGVMELEGVQPAIDQAAELLDRARSAGIPVIHIQHDDGEGEPLRRARRVRRDRGPGGAARR